MKTNSPGYRIKTSVKALIIACSVFFSVSICLTPWIKMMESMLTDTLFFLRGEQKTPGEAVIVAIDEESFSAFGLAWPWPRRMHAKLIETLYRNGASVVAMDVIFGEPSSPEDDEALKNILASRPETVLASNIQVIDEKGYSQKIITLPSESMSPGNVISGSANLPVESDGFIRRLADEEEGIKPFSLETARMFCLKKNVKTCGLEHEKIPGKPEINFSGPARTIKTVSYYQAMDPEKYLTPGFFKGRMVFVGFVTGVNTAGKDKGHDSYPVPFTRWMGGYMPGVEIHANAALNIVRNNMIMPVSTWASVTVGIIAGIVSGLIFLSFTSLGSAIFLLSSLLSLSAFSFFMFVQKYTRIPLTFLLFPQVSAYIASTIVKYSETWKEKRFITSAFTTYLSPGLMQRLLKDPKALKPGGESVEATVMFLDFEDFTSLSEKTPPDDLIRLLNDYLEGFTDIIFRWNGMVDKFIGDAVMAVWGVPIKDENHAGNACMAALEIKNWVEKKAEEKNENKIAVRIGINTGTMTAGNVGGARHFNYTVIGDAVNIASRLEGANRIYGTRIIAGHGTIKKTGEAIGHRFLDFVRVKGKSNPIRIYEIKEKTDPLQETLKKADDLFEQAMELYEDGKWQEACDYFKKAAAINPSDKASTVFARRCEEFADNPPAADWDKATSLVK